ncbi:hypothetical protein CJ030_MR3G026351 [Morella rubra]|uniref:Protein kinase domain-containing protein n=1 Tax=Morella rubra TaxID=262757 RepID=A0A6A1VZU4_9ROSI|nr:hypothetical protein CJ030_MR3G026351 [Morella rubra]
MEFSWNPDDDESGYYLYMHFAEFIKLEANQSRSFNITFNGEPWFGPFVPRYLNAQIVFTKSALTGGKYAFSIFKTESSTLPPIINAIELFSVKYLLQSETHQDDVDVITKIKSMYGIKRNWQGDPCAPRAYFWEGLNCSYDYSNPPRITFLNLSSSGLTGATSVDISNLVMLEILKNLEGNRLTGSVPLELIERSNDGSLSLRFFFMDVDDKKANILNWECRLQIAIDAAQGLEYLHHGSKPPIFHRDVKCTNILLSENFQSKLADFGMSKIYPPDAGSHVSTVVVGTQGYVDPEYYLSNRLTEKSDVYSFGVVLLRIITGRPVMERSREMTQSHISRWVSSMLANGDIRNIVDQGC